MGVLLFQRGDVLTRRLWRVVVVLLVCGMGGGSLAAIPSVGQVTVKAQRALSRTTPVRLTYTEVKAEAPATVAMRLVVVPEVGVRLERLSLSGEQISNALTRVWHVSGALRDGSVGLDQAPAWLQVLAGRNLKAVLQTAGVNTGRVSLAHVDGTILWVLGAGPLERSRPQLHVVRATGQPWRIIARSSRPDGPHEDVVFEGVAAVSEQDTSWWPTVLRLSTPQGTQRFELTGIERDLKGASEALLMPKQPPVGGAPK
jgi:hypothetical protein